MMQKGDEMNIKIYFNKAFKQSANLIALETKCSYFNLTDDELIIDGRIAANQLTLKKINSIEFITGGYKSTIAVKEHEPIKSSIYNHNNFTIRRNLDDVIYFIKEI